jgi:hypothetical protein
VTKTANKNAQIPTLPHQHISTATNSTLPHQHYTPSSPPTTTPSHTHHKNQTRFETPRQPLEQKNNTIQRKTSQKAQFLNKQYIKHARIKQKLATRNSAALKRPLAITKN